MVGATLDVCAAGAADLSRGHKIILRVFHERRVGIYKVGENGGTMGGVYIGITFFV